MDGGSLTPSAGLGAGVRWLVAVAFALVAPAVLAGCSDPAPPVAVVERPGPLLMSEPVAETGTTSYPGPPPPSPVLASCQRGRGTVHYVGPFGDGIVALSIVGTWDATSVMTQELAFHVTCGKGRNLAAEPCEGFEEVRVSGASPLALDMAD